MRVVLGEHEGLRDLLAPREHLREEPLLEGAHHEPYLVLGHHVAVKLVGRVGEVVVQRRVPLRARPAVAPGDEEVRLVLQRSAALRHPRADAVHVEADVHGVGDCLLVAVLHDQVAAEEPYGLLGWRGRQPDQGRVEVLEHLPPEVVYRAVALINYDEVEGLYGDARVVGDRQWFAAEGWARLEHRALLPLLLELLLAAEHGVQALDGGYADPAHGVYGVGAQELHVVLVCEGAAGVGAHVLLELGHRLRAQVLAVHEEEHPPRARELDEPVDERHGGERLAAAGGHLHQRARPVLRERPLQVPYRPYLRGPQPLLDQGRHLPQPLADLLILPRESQQLLRAVEGEDLAAPGVGLEGVGELRERPRALVGEGQRQAVGRDEVGHPAHVPGRLRLDAPERPALRLGLDHAYRFAVGVEQVVGEAVAPLERKLAHRDAACGGDVHLGVVLHGPAARLEVRVYLLSRPLFRGLSCQLACPLPLRAPTVERSPTPRVPRMSCHLSKYR